MMMVLPGNIFSTSSSSSSRLSFLFLTLVIMETPFISFISDTRRGTHIGVVDAALCTPPSGSFTNIAATQTLMSDSDGEGSGVAYSGACHWQIGCQDPSTKAMELTITGGFGCGFKIGCASMTFTRNSTDVIFRTFSSKAFAETFFDQSGLVDVDFDARFNGRGFRLDIRCLNVMKVELAINGTKDFSQNLSVPAYEDAARTLTLPTIGVDYLFSTSVTVNCPALYPSVDWWIEDTAYALLKNKNIRAILSFDPSLRGQVIEINYQSGSRSIPSPKLPSPFTIEFFGIPTNYSHQLQLHVTCVRDSFHNCRKHFEQNNVSAQKIMIDMSADEDEILMDDWDGPLRYWKQVSGTSCNWYVSCPRPLIPTLVDASGGLSGLVINSYGSATAVLAGEFSVWATNGAVRLVGEWAPGKIIVPYILGTPTTAEPWQGIPNNSTTVPSTTDPNSSVIVSTAPAVEERGEYAKIQYRMLKADTIWDQAGGMSLRLRCWRPTLSSNMYVINMPEMYREILSNRSMSSSSSQGDISAMSDMELSSKLPLPFGYEVTHIPQDTTTDLVQLNQWSITCGPARTTILQLKLPYKTHCCGRQPTVIYYGTQFLWASDGSKVLPFSHCRTYCKQIEDVHLMGSDVTFRWTRATGRRSREQITILVNCTTIGMNSPYGPNDHLVVMAPIGGALSISSDPDGEGGKEKVRAEPLNQTWTIQCPAKKSPCQIEFPSILVALQGPAIQNFSLILYSDTGEIIQDFSSFENRNTTHFEKLKSPMVKKFVRVKFVSLGVSKSADRGNGFSFLFFANVSLARFSPSITLPVSSTITVTETFQMETGSTSPTLTPPPTKTQTQSQTLRPPLTPTMTQTPIPDGTKTKFRNETDHDDDDDKIVFSSDDDPAVAVLSTLLPNTPAKATIITGSVASVATAVVNPTSPSQAIRILAVSKLALCSAFEGEEEGWDPRPSFIEFPIQPPVGTSAKFQFYMGGLLASTGLIVLPFLLSLFMEKRIANIRRGQRKSSHLAQPLTSGGDNDESGKKKGGSQPNYPKSTAEKIQSAIVTPFCALALGYAVPPILGAVIAVFLEQKKQKDEEGAGIVVEAIVVAALSFVIVVGVLVYLAYLILINANFRSKVKICTGKEKEQAEREKTDPFMPIGASASSYAFIATYRLYFDGASDVGNAKIRAFFFEDVTIAILVTVLATVSPPSTWGCSAIGAVILLVGFVHIAYLLYFRPYDKKLEQGFAVLNASLFIGMGVCAIGVIWNREGWTKPLAMIMLCAEAIFFVQAIAQCVWAYVVKQRREYYRRTATAARKKRRSKHTSSSTSSKKKESSHSHSSKNKNNDEVRKSRSSKDTKKVPTDDSDSSDTEEDEEMEEIHELMEQHNPLDRNATVLQVPKKEG